jgi:hypothetical protein
MEMFQAVGANLVMEFLHVSVIAQLIMLRLQCVIVIALAMDMELAPVI